jgi:hypothetical protein
MPLKTKQKGRKWTDKQRANHSRIFKGRVFTTEWKAKISKTLRDGRRTGTRAGGYKNGKYVDIGRLRRENPYHTRPDKCEGCGRTEEDVETKKLYIDHDHSTGQFRGWLCHGCNVILGFARDTPERLTKLVDYLQK